MSELITFNCLSSADALKLSENAKMRDYQADELKGANYVKPKTPFQRRRDSRIAENERIYMALARRPEDLRSFLARARYFTEPDVRRKSSKFLPHFNKLFLFFSSPLR